MSANTYISSILSGTSCLPNVTKASSAWKPKAMQQAGSGLMPPLVPTDLNATLPEDLGGIRFPAPPVISSSPNFPTLPMLPEDNMLSLPSSLQSPSASQIPISPFLGTELPPSCGIKLSGSHPHLGILVPGEAAVHP
ncbi:hypothetical protein PAXRUDRAFT_21357 [Paxillus rubicundulus Ve08.2h10]|uniref:Uncharacterized protein n=1 Tax=Paxillus rubicundulus Ve08.2h10 TaxID=930991 RepID=A0A0D0BN58_9AGAM|nr:hypothetical protein PAXRUDRAFT_21357 [Paxillus rubicundulus Ve08.2h10]